MGEGELGMIGGWWGEYEVEGWKGGESGRAYRHAFYYFIYIYIYIYIYVYI